MKDKKHLDRLFQEKLKDLEVTPSDSVWNNISSELQNLKIESNRKKGVPVWWRIAGIAAGLALLITVGQFMLDESITDVPVENIVDIDSENDYLIDEIKEGANNTVNSVEENKNSSNAVSESSSLFNNSESSTIQNTNQNQISISEKNSANINTDTKNRVNDGISTYQKETEVVESKIKPNYENSNPNNSNLAQGSVQINSVATEKENTALNENNQSTESPASNENDLKNAVETQELVAVNEENKISLEDEIAMNEDELEEDDEKEDFKKWSASSNIAPVYFNTLGNGSSIHPQFNNNSKTGDINMSYGIAASYAISKKLSVRAGVNKVNLGYSTNNVVVYNNIEPINDSALLRNIAIAESAQNTSFLSVEGFNFAQVPGPLSHFINSSIDQKLGFIEVPLELKYKLTDKKMSINVIGGFSTFILNSNEVYTVDNGKSTLLGKATNINGTSFSANFGMGFDFKISDNFNFNLEPVFKYQLNTFNNTSGEFKPYVIGVYSGLSFKF